MQSLVLRGIVSEASQFCTTFSQYHVGKGSTGAEQHEGILSRSGFRIALNGACARRDGRRFAGVIHFIDVGGDAGKGRNTEYRVTLLTFSAFHIHRRNGKVVTGAAV